VKSKLAITATIAVLGAAAIYEVRQAANARAEAQELQQRQAPLVAQIEQLQSERDEATNRLASLAQRGNTELLKLRGEVARLRVESQELAELRAESTGKASKRRVGGFIPKEQLANVGFATPEAALRSNMAALMSGDYARTMASMAAPDEPTEESRESFEKAAREFSLKFKGMQMIAKNVISEDEVNILVLPLIEGEEPRTGIQHLVKSGTEWRLDQSYSGGQIWSGDGQVQWLAPPP